MAAHANGVRFVLVSPLREDMVDDVILTHLHYDHSGNFDRFPHAQFHLQEQELQYATGRYMQYPHLQHAFELDDVCGLVRMNYSQRVRFYEGDDEVRPGVHVHRTGGHSAGLQFVSVHTKRGWVVLASDSSHYYEHMESYRPFSIAFHVGEMMANDWTGHFRKLRLRFFAILAAKTPLPDLAVLQRHTAKSNK